MDHAAPSGSLRNVAASDVTVSRRRLICHQFAVLLRTDQDEELAAQSLTDVRSTLAGRPGLEVMSSYGSIRTSPFLVLSVITPYPSPSAAAAQMEF